VRLEVRLADRRLPLLGRGPLRPHLQAVLELLAADLPGANLVRQGSRPVVLCVGPATRGVRHSTDQAARSASISSSTPSITMVGGALGSLRAHQNNNEQGESTRRALLAGSRRLNSVFLCDQCRSVARPHNATYDPGASIHPPEAHRPATGKTAASRRPGASSLRPSVHGSPVDRGLREERPAGPTPPMARRLEGGWPHLGRLLGIDQQGKKSSRGSSRRDRTPGRALETQYPRGQP